MMTLPVGQGVSLSQIDLEQCSLRVLQVCLKPKIKHFVLRVSIDPFAHVEILTCVDMIFYLHACVCVISSRME